MTTEHMQTTSDDAQRVTLRSTLRIGDVGDFKNECDALFAGSAPSSLVCDASAVEFIDAAALQYLVALSRSCADAQRAFEIGTPSAAFISAAQVSGYARPLGLESA